MINKKIVLGLWAAIVCAAQNQQPTPEQLFLQSLSASLEANNRNAVLLEGQKKAREQMEVVQAQKRDAIMKEEDVACQSLWNICLEKCRSDLYDDSIREKMDILNQEIFAYEKIRYCLQTETNEWRNLTPAFVEKYIVPNDSAPDESTFLFQTGKKEDGTLKTVKADRALVYKYMPNIKAIEEDLDIETMEENPEKPMLIFDAATPLPLILVLECMEAFDKGNPLPKRSYISYNTMDIFFNFVTHNLDFQNAFIDATGEEFLSPYFFENVRRGFFSQYLLLDRYLNRFPLLAVMAYGQLKEDSQKTSVHSASLDACVSHFDDYFRHTAIPAFDFRQIKGSKKHLELLTFYSKYFFQNNEMILLGRVILTNSFELNNIYCKVLLIDDSFCDSINYSNAYETARAIKRSRFDNTEIRVSSEEQKKKITDIMGRVRIRLFTPEDLQVLQTVPQDARR
ncbi:MAG: hypothetical protein CNLJKLNK_00633 [Holosporales bacterium]